MTPRRADILILLGALAVFWTATFYQIRLPGLYYDEAADVVPAMQIVVGDPNRLDMAQGVHIGPLRLPVMVMVYVGAVSTYAVLPLYWLLGVSVETTRAMTILMASLGVVFAYFFLKDLFDRRVAALSTLLVAIHPAFVFWSRMGIYVSSPMLTMATGSLFCLLRWRRRGQARYLYGAALLMGLGMSTKLLFLWFILAVFGASLLLGLLPRLRLGRWVIGQDGASPELSLRSTLAACMFFAAGAWMIIWYNLRTHETVRFMLRNLFTTEAGANNLDVPGNLRKILLQLIKMLDGSWHQGVWGPAFVNNLFPAVFFASLAVLVVFLLRRSLPWPWRRVAFVILFVALIWLQSAFTITGLGSTHLYILYPFPQALIALAALALARHVRVPAIAFVVIAAVMLTDAWAVVDHHRTLSQSGGIRGFSDVVYDLTTALEEHAGPVAAADWGFRASIALLTQGRVWPVEVFGYNARAPQEDFAGRIKPFLADPNARILFHSPQQTTHQGRLAAARALAAEMKRTLVLERTFYQRDGTELVYIYRTEDAR
jgi:4-amino-4-deoxy-L-arabinose transferase-like glycosyltransferase